MGLFNRWRKRRGQKLTTPDGLPAVEFPPSFTALLNLYGLRGTYGQIFRTQPNVRAVVEFLAREAADLKIKVYEKVPTSPGLPDGRLELPDHDLSRVLAHPSPGVTRYQLWEDTTSDFVIYNVAYWQKIRVRGQVRAVVRVPPSALLPERDHKQRIVRYRTQDSGIILPSELVIFHGYDPELHDGFVSPLETLRRILAEEAAAGQNREGTWKNASRKSGLVQRPLEAPPWSAEAREAWRSDWESWMSGWTNAGRAGLLEDGMKWVDANWSPEQMEYLGARELSRKETAAALGIDPRLVGAHDEAATPDVRTAFYVGRLNPMLTRFSEEIDLQLLPELEPFDTQHRVFTEFNLQRKLRGSFLERARVASTAVGQPWITPNEARAFENLPPVEDGDKLAVPLNTVAGGGPQANPQAPIETPGGDPAPGETPGDGVQRRAVLFTDEEFKWLQAQLAERSTPAPEPDAEPDAKRVQAAGDLLKRHHARQHRTAISLAGAARKAGVSFPVDDNTWERWHKELAADLSEGSETRDWKTVAVRINAETRARINAAGTDPAALKQALDTGPREEDVLWIVRLGFAGKLEETGNEKE